MRYRIGLAVITLSLIGSLAQPARIAAQIPNPRDIQKAAEDATRREVLNKTDELVTNAIRCVFDNLECIRKAEDEGEPVVLTGSRSRIRARRRTRCR